MRRGFLERDDDDAYFYGPILFLKRELKRNCNYMHFWELDSLSPFEFIVLQRKKNDLTKYENDGHFLSCCASWYFKLAWIFCIVVVEICTYNVLLCTKRSISIFINLRRKSENLHSHAYIPLRVVFWLNFLDYIRKYHY